MSRKLFCEWSPLTYRISNKKEILKRNLSDWLSPNRIAAEKSVDPLPVLLYAHNSLIRRTLGSVDPILQNNKAVNLSIAAPKVNGILIRPGELFSFWSLVGRCTGQEGYLDGMTVGKDGPSQDIGGGLCQFTNLIHWMVLHTCLEVVERHHHDGVDLFPDYNRQVPFGVGTSIYYNYVDYRFKNNTDTVFQLLIHTNELYLCGELRCDRSFPFKYHIRVSEEFFTREDSGIYRNTTVERVCVDTRSGDTLSTEVLSQSHAKIMYDENNIAAGLIR